jgi:fumarate reductase flavoprotein subunit
MLWYDNSADAINWYGDRVEERGVKMWHEAATENPDKVSLYRHWPTGHSPAWPMGSDGKQTLDGAAVLTDYANKLGVEFHYETPMVKLAQENDKVVGAIAKQPDGSYIQVNAKNGAIVCTGGYASNTDMLNTLQPETLSVVSQSSAIPGTEGDGIKACLWAGARMDETHASMLFDRSCIAPDGYTVFGGDGGLFWMGSQPWLKVNLEGKRFANEGGGVYDYILHAASHESHHTYCTIFDSNYATWAAQFDMHGCSRLFPFENGAPSNMTIQTIEGMNKGLIEQGYIQQADTIEGLAEKLGVPKDNLAATVKRSNELYDKGVDEDFGKEPFRLSRIDTPPYYGVRQAGRLLCTMDGIIINEKFQAMREDGTPIEGLYVIGNDSGGYYATSYPNQSTGNACGRTVTFGRMVGKQLAKK